MTHHMSPRPLAGTRFLACLVTITAFAALAAAQETAPGTDIDPIAILAQAPPGWQCAKL